MKYRYLPTTAEGVVQLIAASYLRHGSYWYVTGRVPAGKVPTAIDQKLIAKYGIDITEWTRSKRRKSGLANAHYIRFHDWFILLVTEGHHKLKAPSHDGGEGEQLKDCRRTPIKFQGYSISYRRSGVIEAGAKAAKWHAHVRIENERYKELKAHFEHLAVHRSKENLAGELFALPFTRYAPVRRQLLNILRSINRSRGARGFEELPHSCLNLRTRPIKIFADLAPDPDTEPGLVAAPLLAIGTLP